MKKQKQTNEFSIENFKKLCDFAESYGIICINCEKCDEDNICEDTYKLCEKTDFCNYFVPKGGKNG
jgi:hypothetical protein